MGGLLDRVGRSLAGTGVGGNAVHVEFRPQHTAAADDELVHAWIADHHAGHVGGCVLTFEIAPGSAEFASVLVHVEQQHQTAVQFGGEWSEVGSDVTEDRGCGLGVGAASAP